MNISEPAFQIERRIALPEDEVHLWRIDLASAAKGEQRWEQVLSPDERARASRFHFSQDRQYFSATRALLRTLLAGYVGANPTELVFYYSEKEKPSLISVPSGSHVEFNVSHSGAVALLAFARGRALGVDVEQLRENFDHAAIARRFFSEQEQRQLLRSHRRRDITVSSDAGPARKRTSRPREPVCRSRSTSLTFP